MRTPPCILVVDDNPMNVDILQTRLTAHGYAVITASDGEQALATARAQHPDLILLDVMMPKVDGVTVCRELKADTSLPFMPIIMVTAKSDSQDIVAGLEAGAEEYLTKPVDHAALMARVKSMLRIKELHDEVQAQSAQLVEWNQTLEQRVRDQLEDLERVGRLKRFFSPQLCDLIVSKGGEQLLQSHRSEISVVFCDLRGFTAFSETAEPEEVNRTLQEFFAGMGELIFEYEGTIERFVGDSIMVLFNDPLPCSEHELRAVRMALAMQTRAGELIEIWEERGHQLGLGIGIARGYATVGQIGFEGRMEYSATGTVANLAARLCDIAQPGQILICQQVHAAVGDRLDMESLGDRDLKGFSKPMPVYSALGLQNGEASTS
ncbi:MAG: response regulator [Gammaproteobacteria bacterium]|jgi:class 3 adenylate cyclase|nr:response regulator [Gammaproteobacteria bacterium]